MMNPSSVDLGQGDPARRIRPIMGMSPVASGQAVAQAMPTNRAGEFYNRRQTLTRDRAREEEAARIRAEARDEARRVAKIQRRQDLEDDVRDRNREIEDANRTREEQISDDELEYLRRLPERERAAAEEARKVAEEKRRIARDEREIKAEKIKNRLDKQDRTYELKLRKRNDLLFKQQQEDYKEKKDRIKSDRIITLQKAYAELLDDAGDSQAINSARQAVQNERQRIAQLAQQNQIEASSAAIQTFANAVLSEDSMMEETDRDRLLTLMKDQGFDLEQGGVQALLSLPPDRMIQLAGSLKGQIPESANYLMQAFDKIQQTSAERQKDFNIQIQKYNELATELATKKTMSDESVSYLKSVFASKLSELGVPIPERPEPEELDEEPEAEDASFDIYSYIDEMGLTEEEEDALLDIFDPDSQLKGDAPLEELNLNKDEVDRALESIRGQKIIQSDMQKKQAEIDDKEGENPTLTGDAIDLGKDIIKGAGELAERSGVGIPDIAPEVGAGLAVQQAVSEDSTAKKMIGKGRALITPTDKKVDETLDALADAETNAKTNPDAIKGSAYQNQMNEFGRKYGFRQFTKKPPTATKDLPKYFTEIEDHFTSQAQAKVKDRLNSVITKARNTGDKMRSSKIMKVLGSVGAAIAIADIIRLLSYDGSENDEEIQALKQELSVMEKDYQAIKDSKRQMAQEYMKRIAEEMEARKQ